MTKFKKGQIKDEHVWACLLYTTSIVWKIIVAELMFFVAIYIKHWDKQSLIGIIINVAVLIIIFALQPRFARRLAYELEQKERFKREYPTRPEDMWPKNN